MSTIVIITVDVHFPTIVNALLNALLLYDLRLHQYIITIGDNRRKPVQNLKLSFLKVSLFQLVRTEIRVALSLIMGYFKNFAKLSSFKNIFIHR
jgi:hypothetical protein